MALAVVAVVPPATMAGIYYWIVIHEGSPLMAYPAVLAMLFLLRALIRGWLRRPPAVRRAPERSGPSQPIQAEADAERRPCRSGPGVSLRGPQRCGGEAVDTPSS